MKHKITGNVLIVSSDDYRFEVLSTGVQGGRRAVDHILSIQVPPDFPHDNPEGYIQQVARSLQLRGAYVALLTAVDMQRAQILSDACATVFVTAGVPSAPSVGTINIIVMASKALSEGAMAGTIITTTESKTRALLDMGLNIMGTPTDAVVIAYEKNDDSSRIAYAGPSTYFGRRIGALIRRGVADSLKARS